MSAAKEIRERYGISQPDLALYLSVSLSLLKQAEVNARMLPTKALIKLSAVTLYKVKEGITKTMSFEAGATATTHKKLERSIKKAALQLYIAQQQLEKALKKYGQAQRLLALCNYLLDQNPTDEVEKPWLEGQQLAAKQRLKKHGK